MSKKIAKIPNKVEIEEAEITPVTSTTLVPKRKLLDFPVHKKNPFLDTTVIHSRNKRITVKAGSAIVDMGTGEIEGQTDIVQVLKVDDAKFIKVFTQNVGLYFELGLGGLRLLQLVYVLAQNRPGKDRIYMNPETMYDQLPANVPKLSLATFYRSLAELLNKDILARIESDIHWYFINPALFFNGDRIRFITQYDRMTKDEQRAEQEEQLRIEQERKQKRLDFGD